MLFSSVNKISNSLSIALALVLASGCSTKKNTFVSRNYHNVTSYYNVYFNGMEAFKEGQKKIAGAHKDNFSLVLLPFLYSDKEAARASYSDMNKAIEKGSKCIRKHSITVKPEKKEGKKERKDKSFYEKNEYVNWIDEAYMLIGKSQLIKQDYYAAIETFSYVVRQFKDSDVKYEAYMWIARCYTEMGNFDKANDFVNMLTAEKAKIPVELEGPINITKADIFLRQRNYTDAIPFVEKAVELTKTKKDKRRYLYILAQLYQINEENKKAYITYGKVIDLNPEYDMVFNARINRAGIFNSSSGDSRSLQKELTKMLKDEKNFDYRDQIYYALGNIAFNESRDGDALNFYKLSAKVSTTNTNQKGVSFLAIADMYFAIPDYRNAQAYYDSSVTVLSRDYPDYNNIKRKSENLNELVSNMDVIHTQDSLQRIAKLPEPERNQIIDQQIAMVIEQEQKAKEEEAARKSDLAYMEQQNRTQSNQTGSKWYFYNPTSLSMGQAEFKKKWGDRKLEDNWRRSNKSEMNWEGTEADSEKEGESQEKVLSNKSREYYLVNIPLSDSAMQVSQEKIEEAYFNLGTIYKEKFDDYPLSIQTFLDFVAKYPTSKYKLSSLYTIYKLYLLEKDYKNADAYKETIIRDYPKSDYAKILSDPEYFKELERIAGQLNFMYQATYRFFLNDSCRQVEDNYHYVDTAYPESPLIPKFALLSTLCQGKSGDTLAFKAALNNFMKMFPDSEEKNYANDVLAALDRKHELELKEKKPEFGAEVAADMPVDSIDISMYNYNERSSHYYMIVVANDKADANRVKFNLTNFNLDYFSYLDFDVSSVLLSANYTMIVVKKFKNMKMARNYLESVNIAGEVFEDIVSDAYREYLISDENFTKFYDDKNVSRYQKFFSRNYKIE